MLGEVIGMYTAPKIVASLDAQLVLAAALGHHDDNSGSQVTWDR
jgi:hypothetical protein